MIAEDPIESNHKLRSLRSIFNARTKISINGQGKSSFEAKLNELMFDDPNKTFSYMIDLNSIVIEFQQKLII